MQKRTTCLHIEDDIQYATRHFLYWPDATCSCSTHLGSRRRLLSGRHLPCLHSLPECINSCLLKHSPVSPELQDGAQTLLHLNSSTMPCSLSLCGRSPAAKREAAAAAHLRTSLMTVTCAAGIWGHPTEHVPQECRMRSPDLYQSCCTMTLHMTESHACTDGR